MVFYIFLRFLNITQGFSLKIRLFFDVDEKRNGSLTEFTLWGSNGGSRGKTQKDTESVKQPSRPRPRLDVALLIFHRGFSVRAKLTRCPEDTDIFYWENVDSAKN